MAFINIEIKARTARSEAIRKFLADNQADFRGRDIQTDTYFNALRGRLKLREGNIENTLIYYERADTGGPRASAFSLVEVNEPVVLKDMLTAAAGIKVVVKKQRDIYFLGNVKIHLDSLEGLGHFVEIEASNRYADLSKEELARQCDHYIEAFGIRPEDHIAVSYSDMLLGR